MPSPPANLTTLLSELAASKVQFILVGGLAAVAQGAPITTHDVDIVPLQTPDNIAALCAFLGGHNGRYRSRPDLMPSREELMGPGHHLLSTDLGPLDVLGAIEGERDYQSLLARSLELELDRGTIRVLSLDMIVEIKRASDHPKDQLMLPILEAVLVKGT